MLQEQYYLQFNVSLNYSVSKIILTKVVNCNDYRKINRMRDGNQIEPILAGIQRLMRSLKSVSLVGFYLKEGSLKSGEKG